MAASVGVNADEVRSGLRLAMRVGMPVDPAKWPRFALKSAVVTSETDQSGVPWAPASSVPAAPEVCRSPLCAVEWVDLPVRQRHYGQDEPQTLNITMLDEEWATVKGFAYVDVWPADADAPSRFWFRRMLGRYAVDTVEVYQFAVDAEDAQ